MLAEQSDLYVAAYAVERSTDKILNTTVTPNPPTVGGTTRLGFDYFKQYPQLEVTVTIDGKPVAGADVTLASTGLV